jgi:hypothetical protein
MRWVYCLTALTLIGAMSLTPSKDTYHHPQASPLLNEYPYNVDIESKIKETVKTLETLMGVVDRNKHRLLYDGIYQTWLETKEVNRAFISILMRESHEGLKEETRHRRIRLMHNLERVMEMTKILRHRVTQ